MANTGLFKHECVGGVKLEQELNDIERISNILQLGAVANDLVVSLCGKYIGSGISRSVFEYNLDPRYVIKVEPLSTNNNNMVEQMMWNEIHGLCGNLEWVKKWFAPVLWCSPNGRLLVMRKTEEKPGKKRPEMIPEFLWDVKSDNFGWIGNQFVCHDYGQFYNFRHYSKKMKKVNW